mmetsp:Transcript_157967/g.484122  ORF Transcript_157967/g.484122 Transcript_157967/m.484122 type:complete len:245 (+) Transcript_157967:289-1023(+)
MRRQRDEVASVVFYLIVGILLEALTLEGGRLKRLQTQALVGPAIVEREDGLLLLRLSGGRCHVRHPRWDLDGHRRDEVHEVSERVGRQRDGLPCQVLDSIGRVLPEVLGLQRDGLKGLDEAREVPAVFQGEDGLLLILVACRGIHVVGAGFDLNGRRGDKIHKVRGGESLERDGLARLVVYPVPRVALEDPGPLDISDQVLHSAVVHAQDHLLGVLQVHPGTLRALALPFNNQLVRLYVDASAA